MGMGMKRYEEKPGQRHWGYGIQINQKPNVFMDTVKAERLNMSFATTYTLVTPLSLTTTAVFSC